MPGRKPHRPGGITRRDFLVGTGTAAAVTGATLAGCFPDVGGTWAAVTQACADDGGVPLTLAGSRVVEVLREDSVTATPPVQVNEAAVRPMLEAALAAFTDGAPAPWATLLPDYGPTTRIGLKVNCLNQYLATSVPVVKALIASLQEELGVDAERLVVWDRRLDELTRSGFTPEALGVQVVGTVTSVTDTSGPGYTRAICGAVEGSTPLLSRILTELTDLTINVPVLKTHVVSGVTGAMKNIYGVINNPGDYHANLNRALPALYRLPPIHAHIRLTLVDALIAVITGGTSDPPDAQPRRLLLGQDPVAVDSYALDLVNQLRAAHPVSPGAVDPALVGWLDQAQSLSLGVRAYDLLAVAQ
jgi:hypothetical protein